MSHAEEIREVVLLGSTGSIGTQAVDVVRAAPDRFRITALAAGGGRPKLLAEQAAELGVRVVAVSDEDAAPAVREALEAAGCGAELLAGPEAASAVAALPADVVLNGITGATGLGPTLAALKAGSVLALANKESLIMGGSLVTRLAGPGQIVPVDSEHSAIAQCLRGGRRDEVAKLLLTASGGPFRGRTRAELADVTPEQALAHPTWSMGPVVTFNSATLVNKGLEVIEAHLLFGVPLDDIEVVVHPQSIVHSMVRFHDGSTIAQCSPPDMRLPIALGMSWPDRVPMVAPPCDFTTAQTWTFEPLDDDAFPAIRLARACAERGGTYPAVYNAANEACVAAFLSGGPESAGTPGKFGFLDVVDTVADVVAEHVPGAGELTVEGVLAADGWARRRAAERITAGAGVRSQGREPS